MNFTCCHFNDRKWSCTRTAVHDWFCTHKHWSFSNTKYNSVTLAVSTTNMSYLFFRHLATPQLRCSNGCISYIKICYNLVFNVFEHIKLHLFTDQGHHIGGQWSSWGTSGDLQEYKGTLVCRNRGHEISLISQVSLKKCLISLIFLF